MSTTSAARLLQTIESALRERSLTTAMRAFNALYTLENFNPWPLGDCLMRLAVESNNVPAAALAELLQQNLRHVWRDGNLSGQTLFTLAMASPIGDQSDPDVSIEEALQLTSQADRRLQGRWLQVPSWAADGIHTQGSDPRFSGVLCHMSRACAAYERYGRLDPNDDFTVLAPDSAWTTGG